jgi:hypothetical protein
MCLLCWAGLSVAAAAAQTKPQHESATQSLPDVPAATEKPMQMQIPVKISPATILSEDFESGSSGPMELSGSASIVQSGSGHVLAFSGVGTAVWPVVQSEFVLSVRLSLGGVLEVLMSSTNDFSSQPTYIVRLFAKETEIVKRSGTQEKTLSAVGRGLGQNTWKTLKIDVIAGGRGLEVTADGQPLISAEVPNPKPLRFIGFRSIELKGGSQLDDLVLTERSSATAPEGAQGEEVIPINIPEPK